MFPLCSPPVSTRLISSCSYCLSLPSLFQFSASVVYLLLLPRYLAVCILVFPGSLHHLCVHKSVFLVLIPFGLFKPDSNKNLSYFDFVYRLSSVQFVICPLKHVLSVDIVSLFLILNRTHRLGSIVPLFSSPVSNFSFRL